MRANISAEACALGTLPRLAAALELADGRAAHALINFANDCRGVSLVSPSPGGRAAAHVTIEDAANLMIATAAPVPMRLLPGAVAAFRAMPRLGKPREFRVARSRISMAEHAGAFLESLIVNAPRLPDDIRVEFRFSPVGMALIAGIGRTVAAEYWRRIAIGIDPPGGDRVIERSASFVIRTLRLVHDAVA